MLENVDSLLQGVEDEAIIEFVARAQSRCFEAGEVVLGEGESGDFVYLVVAGTVVVTANQADAQQADAQRSDAHRTIARLGPGEVFGEAAMLGGTLRTATVTARTYVDTLALSSADYQWLAAKYPRFQRNICGILASRITGVDAKSTPQENGQSLAIVIEHPAGWELVTALLDRLNEHGPRPLVVAQSEETARERAEVGPGNGRWCDAVAADELHLHIASRSQRGCAVAIATELRSARAVLSQCESSLIIADAEAASSWAAALTNCTASSRASSSRSTKETQPTPGKQTLGKQTVVRVFRDSQRLVPFECDSPAQELRLRVSETGKLNADAVTRTLRAIQGKRIGLALGGGGARGIAHIGVLEVLAKHGVVFDEVAGTSAGAIIGATYAQGMPMSQVAEMFRSDFMPPRFLASSRIGRRLFLWRAFRGNRLESIFRKHLGSLQFDRLELPFSISAVDLISGERITRRNGDVVRSILESINHPAFGRPILNGNQAIVDGGVVVNVPTAVLAERCQRVVTVDVGSRLSEKFARDKHGELKQPSYLSTVLRAIDVTKKFTSRQHRLKSDVIISPGTARYRLEDFHQIEQLIDLGREAALEAMPEVKAIIEP